MRKVDLQEAMNTLLVVQYNLQVARLQRDDIDTDTRLNNAIGDLESAVKRLKSVCLKETSIQQSRTSVWSFLRRTA